MQVLSTKLHPPPVQPLLVPRERLFERLNAGLAAGTRVMLVSAAAGAGKTTLVSAWVQRCSRVTAWLSLDVRDNSLSSFLVGIIAAFQKVVPGFGTGLMASLQAPQLPATETLLAVLVHEMQAFSEPLVLVLDDVHVLEGREVQQALRFLLNHLPRPVQVVLVSREDPDLPLPRWRVQGHLTEIRMSDLRFTAQEAADFLNGSMHLNLSTRHIELLEARTEGWIAGLQLAALSLQGAPDREGFIQSFSGSHRFVLDYLMEEVWQQQPPEVQDFLLHTAVLERMCGSLCAAVTPLSAEQAQGMLEGLERANLFLVPLDQERGWYRYHHLFAGLLRQRLKVHADRTGEPLVQEGHLRASVWFEQQGLGLEAFEHAVAARDLDRAEGLLLSRKLPLHLRGTVDRVLEWMAALPPDVWANRPLLCALEASFHLVRGQTRGIEEKINIAEQAFRAASADPQARNLLGQVFTMRSTLALTRYQLPEVLTFAEQALEHLHPQDLSYRASALWTRATSLLLQGDRKSAAAACHEALRLSRRAGDAFSELLALTGAGHLEELNLNYHKACDIYQQVLQQSGDPPLPSANDAFLGLGRLALEKRALDDALQYGEQGLLLARQYGPEIDRFVVSELFVVRCLMVRGEAQEAQIRLKGLERTVQQDFPHRLPDILALRVELLLQQGRHEEAQNLARHLQDPLSLLRVALAVQDFSQAVNLADPLLEHFKSQGWQEEQARLLCLRACALQGLGQTRAALQDLREVLEQVAHEGAIQMFLDAGPSMAGLLRRLLPTAPDVLAQHIQRVLTCFPASPSRDESGFLLDSLSKRECEILQLVAEGLSNHQIGERLNLALDTVKGHNRNIFDKLQVRRRTEAVRRARELGLLS